MILNYKPEIKRIIQSLYKPADIDNDVVVFLTLDDLVENLLRVIPPKQVVKTDVYEVLKELKFKISQNEDNEFGFMAESII